MFQVNQICTISVQLEEVSGVRKMVGFIGITFPMVFLEAVNASMDPMQSAQMFKKLQPLLGS